MSKWQAAADTLLRESGASVTKYRRSMSGVAFTGPLTERGSKVEIEAPEPKGPISFAIFAHEIGHQVLHRDNGRTPRWKEEVEAWEFALKAVQRFDLPGYERVEARAARSIAYAFRKARRRGVEVDTIKNAYPVWWKRALETDWLWLI